MNFTQVTIAAGGVTSTDLGRPTASLAHDAAIYGVAPDNLIAWASPNRIPAVGATVTDADAVNPSRLWTAQSAGVTRATDDAVLDGLPRWVGDDTASSYMAADLDKVLGSYTIALLFRSTGLGSHNGLFGVGGTASSRLMVFQKRNGKMAMQHGTGDSHDSAATYGADVWLSVIATYDDATGAANVYVDNTASPDTYTMANRPPQELAAAFMGGANGSSRHEGDFVLGVVWDTVLDGTARDNVMDGLTGLAAL